MLFAREKIPKTNESWRTSSNEVLTFFTRSRVGIVSESTQPVLRFPRLWILTPVQWCGPTTTIHIPRALIHYFICLYLSISDLRKSSNYKMARNSSTSLLLQSSFSLSPSPQSLLLLRRHSPCANIFHHEAFPFRIQKGRNGRRGRRRKPISLSLENVRKEQVIVVGAGIAGLAAALSLHRFSSKSPTNPSSPLISLPDFVFYSLFLGLFSFWGFTKLEFRLGVGSLVLEQSESLRVGGTSLTLFKNGWRVLDAMGVGDLLRAQFLEIQG